MPGKSKNEVENRVINWYVSNGMLTLENIKGKNFVMTGKLSVTRAEMQQFINQFGGYNQSAIGSNTDFLIVPAGDDFTRGSKWEEAKRRGVKVINEEEFVDMIISETVKR